MNDMLQIIILAIVQGITEFLPVSSSGHLVLIGHLINFDEQGNMTEVILHIGTFIAVVVYFRKRLIKLAADLIRKDPEARSYLGALFLGSLPLVAVYVLAGNYIESLFDKPLWAGVFLCCTGAILLSLRLRGRLRVDEKISPGRGLIVGLAQAVALLPGISRSGSTIVASRHLGITPAVAAEFSFLLYLPAMAGAIVIKIGAVMTGLEKIVLSQAIVGTIVSAVVGYGALAILIQIVKRSKLWTFGIYCLIAGIIALLVI